MFINIICILNIKYYMYFEYYLYMYFCFSVVILLCVLVNINFWFNSKYGKVNSCEKLRRIIFVKMYGVLFFSIF